MAYSERTRTEDSSMDWIRNAVLQRADDFKHAIEGARQFAMTMAMAGDHERYFRNPACGKMLASLKTAFPAYANFAFIEADGDITCSATPLPGKVNIADIISFRLALVSDMPQIGPPEQGRVAKSKMIIPVTIGLKNAAGKATGVFAASIDLSAYLAKSTAAAQSMNIVYTFWSDEGVILARSPDLEGLAGQSQADAPIFQMIKQGALSSGTARLPGPDGVEKIYAFTRFEEQAARFWITAGVPTAELLGPSLRSYHIALMLFTLALLAGVGTAWTFSETAILKPLRKLHDLASSFAQGERMARVGKTGGAMEIRAIATAFDRMADALSQEDAERARAESALLATKQTLEQRVLDRTSELQEAVAVASERNALLETRRHDLIALNEMSDLLQSCQTLDEACLVLDRSMPVLFGMGTGGAYLFRESNNLLERVAMWGGELPISFLPDDCWALRLGRTYSSIQGDARPHCSHFQKPTSHATHCVPLLAQGKTLGTLVFLWDGDGQPSDLDSRLKLVQAAADRISLALANIKLRQSLRDLSIRDALTGLYNRRFVEETFEREMARIARTQEPFCLMMMDVDHFKRFNDTFGHDAGDLVLRSVGELLRDHFRSTDLPCRYGGEEFLVMLPGANLANAQERADALRKAVKALTVLHQGRPVGQITISIGLAAHPSLIANRYALIEAADKALYLAKAQGRDRVVLASEETIPPEEPQTA
ncbi:MAG: diguanylate cyclase [Alphaproteobacteria bacterium]|nr:diguanylate cyclase [Alphaproteobacteria bacterium]